MNRDNGSVARHLRGIKVVLILTLLVSLAHLGLTARYNLYQWRRESLAQQSDFVTQAKILANDARYDFLLTLSLTREKERPKDIYAFWYEGVARYANEDWKGSIQAFQHYGDLAPNTEATVLPVITSAQAKLSHKK